MCLDVFAPSTCYEEDGAYPTQGQTNTPPSARPQARIYNRIQFKNTQLPLEPNLPGMSKLILAATLTSAYIISVFSANTAVAAGQ